MSDSANHALKRTAPDDNAGNAAKKSKPDMQTILAQAKARAEAARAAHGLPSSASPTPAPGAAAAGPALTPAQQRLAEMKARLSASKAAVASAVGGVRATPAPVPVRPPPQDEPMEEPVRARGGLDVGLHPALLADSDVNNRHRKDAIAPRFATTLANRRADSTTARPAPKAQKKKLEISAPSPDFSDPSKNPYFDPKLGASAPRSRAPKALIFNQKGKYIEQANALRRQAALEAMKKRIAETARKVGIDEDLETDKAFLREAPPDIEWWDQGLCRNASYDDIENNQLLIDTDDSIITAYVQHPIQIEPPQEKHIPPPKPLPLTAKEQAKKRRQQRMENLKEVQAKQRLGLEPAPPPKIKKGNMMRVLGEEAVKNPTAVEARVDREIAERKNQHLKMNEERKLTKEQKFEKLQQNREKDLQKGIRCIVFRFVSFIHN